MTALDEEKAAARSSIAALRPLDAAGRRRAVTWVAVVLGVDLSDYDREMAIEATRAAGLLDGFSNEGCTS